MWSKIHKWPFWHGDIWRGGNWKSSSSLTPGILDQTTGGEQDAYGSLDKVCEKILCKWQSILHIHSHYYSWWCLVIFGLKFHEFLIWIPFTNPWRSYLVKVYPVFKTHSGTLLHESSSWASQTNVCKTVVPLVVLFVCLVLNGLCPAFSLVDI